MSAAVPSGPFPRVPEASFSFSSPVDALPEARVKTVGSCCDHTHGHLHGAGHAHAGCGQEPHDTHDCHDTHGLHDHPSRHHSHGAGHQHAGHACGAALTTPRATYQTFRSARLDSIDLKEGCACCAGGGVPDGPDEVVSALSTSKNAAGGHGHGHVHAHAGLSLPDTPGEVGLGVVMGVCAGIGFYVGWKNFKQAWDTSRVLGNLRSGKIAGNKHHERAAQRAVESVSANLATSSETASAQGSKVARLDRQRVKNLQAHGSNLWGSKSMQRFIEVFSGGTVMASAALVAGGIFMPLLAAVGTAVQIVYCAAHVGRYLGWELGRTRPTVKLKDEDIASPLVKRGKEVFEARQRHRAKVFKGTSACFVAYGAGAVLLTANAVLGTGMALLLPGVGLFAAGIVTVLVLNNRHIISTFFNNGEAHLERDQQGTKEAQLRRLAHFSDENASVEGLVQSLRQRRLVASRGAEIRGWTQPRRHAARRAALRANEQGAAGEARRHALLAFMAHSAARRSAFVGEALDATRAEQGIYRARHGHLVARVPAVKATLEHLQMRQSALQRQQAVLSQRLLPALRGLQSGPNSHPPPLWKRDGIGVGGDLDPSADPALFEAVWNHLSTLDDGLPDRPRPDHTPDAQEHLDRVTATVADAHAASGGAWWRVIPGGKALDAEKLLAALRAGDAQARACADAFCHAAQLYLLYTYPEVLTQQTGSLVDHLAERMKRSRAAA